MTNAMDKIHCVKNELKKDIRAVSTSVTQLVEDIDTLKRDMKDHQDQVNSTANYQDPTFLNKTKQLIREETQEIRMRELRECNLILTNMEEEDRNTESGTATEEDSDMARVNDMITKCPTTRWCRGYTCQSLAKARQRWTKTTCNGQAGKPWTEEQSPKK